MKFKAGEKVKFLNDSGGGVVSEIIDEKYVKVLTEDGFEIPFPVSELIKSGFYTDYDKENRKQVKKPAEIKPEKGNIETDAENILPENVARNAVKNLALAFVPNDQDNAGMSDIDVYLVNDSPYALSFFIGYQENTSWKYLKTGYLEADTKLHLNSFSQSDISKIGNFHVQLLFLSKGKYFPQTPADKYIVISNVRFYKENTYKENNYFNEKAYIVFVTENLTEKLDENFANELANAMMVKNQETGKNLKTPVKSTDLQEIDLHIEEIADNFNNLSAGEILNMQMNKFYNALEEGIINKIQKMVFIHGIGNGKLKYEVLKALDEKYPDLRYQDASFKEYGYGATMVYLT